MVEMHLTGYFPLSLENKILKSNPVITRIISTDIVVLRLLATQN